MARRDPRPLLDLFPPPDDVHEAPPEATAPPSVRLSDREAALGIDRPLDAREDEQDVDDPSPRPVASLVAALFVLVAAGATAAAYLFRGDIAAILSVWEQVP